MNRKGSRDEKIKDMMESILPCKGRSRRVAFFFKRRERRRVRHLANGNLRSCDSEGYTDKNLKPKYYQTINVDMRRGADKVNPFLRWANHHTRHMKKKEDALGYVRRILPHNLIGDHAYSHWETEVKRRFRKTSLQNRNEVFLFLKIRGIFQKRGLSNSKWGLVLVRPPRDEWRHP